MNLILAEKYNDWLRCIVTFMNKGIRDETYISTKFNQKKT